MSNLLPEPSAASVARQIVRLFDMLGTGNPEVETKAVALVQGCVDQTKDLNLETIKHLNRLRREIEDKAAKQRDALLAARRRIVQLDSFNHPDGASTTALKIIDDALAL